MALHRTFANDLRAPRDARRAIAAFLAGAHLAQLTDDAELLVSELVTNAVRHANGPIEVRAHTRRGYLRLEVSDSCRDQGPAPRTAAPDDEGGRGMELIEKMSTRWGWRICGPTKVVWLDLPLQGPATTRTPADPPKN